MAYCGKSIKGKYLHTLTVVDINTRWFELEVLLNRSQHAVEEAVEARCQALPFPFLGMDSDNDSAFLNANPLRYCKVEKITFTRCRPYRKNDQAHVEQKNKSAYGSWWGKSTPPRRP